jgi:hypothetical protein
VRRIKHRHNVLQIGINPNWRIKILFIRHRISQWRIYTKPPDTFNTGDYLTSSSIYTFVRLYAHLPVFCNSHVSNLHICVQHTRKQVYLFLVCVRFFLTITAHYIRPLHNTCILRLIICQLLHFNIPNYEHTTFDSKYIHIHLISSEYTFKQLALYFK